MHNASLSVCFQSYPFQPFFICLAAFIRIAMPVDCIGQSPRLSRRSRSRRAASATHLVVWLQRRSATQAINAGIRQSARSQFCTGAKAAACAIKTHPVPYSMASSLSQYVSCFPARGWLKSTSTDELSASMHSTGMGNPLTGFVQQKKSPFSSLSPFSINVRG